MFHDMIGGDTLNFRIVGNPKPEAAAENTIWVDTDVPVTGWLIDTAQPETAAEGTVLLHTASAGNISFNALKRNGIAICPTCAKQYLGGVWVNKTAFVWQNGEWKEFAAWLYVSGDECTALTGGWEGRGWGWSASQSGEAAVSVVNGARSLDVTVSGGGIVSGAAHILKDVDLTEVSALTADFELTGNSFRAHLLVLPRNTRYLGSYTLGIQLGGGGGAIAEPRRSKTLDVSGLTGSYDVALGFDTSWTDSKSLTARLYSLKAED